MQDERLVPFGRAEGDASFVVRDVNDRILDTRPEHLERDFRRRLAVRADDDRLPLIRRSEGGFRRILSRRSVGGDGSLFDHLARLDSLQRRAPD